MFHIIFALLLLTPLSLLPMNQLSIKPSNSSSEVCFFIKNINQTKPYEYNDIKNTILIKYIATIKDEKKASEQYHELINVSDYMSLNKTNKQCIQIFLGPKTPMCIQDIQNHKSLKLASLQDYEKILLLPQNIRQKIADKYSSTINVETTITKKYSPSWRKEENINETANANGFMLLCIGFIMDCYSCTFPQYTIISIVPGWVVSHIMYETYKNIYGATKIEKKYKYLPLLPTSSTILSNSL